jgi:hypothetical protein
MFVPKKRKSQRIIKYNISKKWLKCFLIFMKFVISIKNCDSIWLEWFCKPCEEFDNYHIISGCFGGWWP